MIVIRLTVEKQKHFLNFIHILYLFTHVDLLTFAVPTILFAVFGAASGTALSTNASPNLLAILSRIPSVILLVWSNLLIFDLANQRLPDAIVEDKLKNPSRPLPSGCITPLQTRRLLSISLPLVLAVNYYLGPWQETLLLFSVNWMYNDLKGCDEFFVIRNLLISLGYGLYNSAALRIACGADSLITTRGMCWILIVSGVIFTTNHISDMKDQAGDKTRGRRSAPLVLGDGVARWTIVVAVLGSSIACPLFFGLGFWGYFAPVTIGFAIAARTLLLRSSEDDSLTWKMWAIWTVVLFSLPLIKEHAIMTAGLEYIVDKLYVGSEGSQSMNLVGVSSMVILAKSRRLHSYVLSTRLDGNDTLRWTARNLKVTSS